jgi:uncharacterized protein YbjT (DUF2867 family)
MKILIIGATGMLARPVVKKLEEAGFALRLFSRSITKKHFDNPHELVAGDIFNPSDLQKAIAGCDAIHLNLSKLNEAAAMESVLEVAKQHPVKAISYISGATVSEQNRWFWMIDNKFKAEQAILNSGIPYMIFRPSWFFEGLEMMIRGNKATMIGKQPPNHWLAAEDYGRMVATAYQDESKRDAIYYVLGPEKHSMQDLLERYVKHARPDIQKVSTAPPALLKFISWITRNKELKTAAELFVYFQEAREPAIDEKELALLGRPATTFEEWLQGR